MKRLSIPTWLQIIYCICCVMVVICMNLYTVYYRTEFSDILFRIGSTLNFLCALSPLGIICAIWNELKYISKKKSGEANGKLFAWVIIGPIATTFAWLISICSFVHHSGGV